MNLDDLMQQGIRWAEAGRPSEAIVCWERVVEVAQDVGYWDAVATAYTNMGVMLVEYTGNDHRAIEAFRQAMKYTDDPERLGNITLNLGLLATRKAPPDYELAKEHFDFAAQHGDQPTRRQAVQNLAQLRV